MRELAHPGVVFAQIMRMAADLASRGLVHCDFNEFNLLVCAAANPCSLPASYLHNCMRLRSSFGCRGKEDLQAKAAPADRIASLACELAGG